jgi:hypothetical protein
MSLRRNRQVPPPPLPPEVGDLEHLQQWTLDLEAWIKVKVRIRVQQAVMRYVLPGLLISGLGLVGVMFFVYKDSQAEKDRVCAGAIDQRLNFRTFALGQHDQWDDTLNNFDPQSPSVIAIQAINDQRRAETALNFPPPTRENIPACQ